MEDKRVTVNILDKDYQVACQPDERHALIRAANELDTRMRQVRNSGSIVGLERIAIMVALNLCHELQQDSNAGITSAASQTALKRLSDKLDGALPSSTESD